MLLCSLDRNFHRFSLFLRENLVCMERPHWEIMEDEQLLFISPEVFLSTYSSLERLSHEQFLSKRSGGWTSARVMRSSYANTFFFSTLSYSRPRPRLPRSLALLSLYFLNAAYCVIRSSQTVALMSQFVPNRCCIACDRQTNSVLHLWLRSVHQLFTLEKALSCHTR